MSYIYFDFSALLWDNHNRAISALYNAVIVSLYHVAAELHVTELYVLQLLTVIAHIVAIHYSLSQHGLQPLFFILV